jgi:hypothetical protein
MVLGTGKLISNSGFFPCLLLSAERQALIGPLVIFICSIFLIFFAQGFAVQCGYLVFNLHYYADIVAVVICDQTCDTGP